MIINGQRIKRRREQMNLTATMLSAKAGLASQQISKIENDVVGMSLQSFAKLAHELAKHAPEDTLDTYRDRLDWIAADAAITKLSQPLDGVPDEGLQPAESCGPQHQGGD